MGWLNAVDELVPAVENMNDLQKNAIVLCADSYRFGGNWGFVRKSLRDYAEWLEAFKGSDKYVSVYRVSNGVLVLCDKRFLRGAVNTAVPNGLGADFEKAGEAKAKDEYEKYVKFITRIAKGAVSVTGLARCNGYYELCLGIYCVNDTNLIRLNGRNYPAYKVDLKRALSVMKVLLQAGRQVYIPVDNGKGAEWVPLGGIASFKDSVVSIMRCLEIADSDTGVFLTVRFQ